MYGSRFAFIRDNITIQQHIACNHNVDNKLMNEMYTFLKDSFNALASNQSIIMNDLAVMKRKIEDSTNIPPTKAN